MKRYGLLVRSAGPGVGEGDDRGHREGILQPSPAVIWTLTGAERGGPNQFLALFHLEHAAWIAVTGVEAVRGDHSDAKDFRYATGQYPSPKFHRAWARTTASDAVGRCTTLHTRVDRRVERAFEHQVISVSHCFFQRFLVTTIGATPSRNNPLIATSVRRSKGSTSRVERKIAYGFQYIGTHTALYRQFRMGAAIGAKQPPAALYGTYGYQARRRTSADLSARVYRTGANSRHRRQAARLWNWTKELINILRFGFKGEGLASMGAPWLNFTLRRALSIGPP